MSPIPGQGHSVRVGLLGLGQMGRNHLRVLSLLRGVEMSFVFDTDSQRAAAVAAQHGIRAVTDLEAAAEGIDAVIICTPTSTHADYLRLLAPRVRHIFVEKPLVHDYRTAVELEELIRAHGNQIQVGFIERFNPAIIGLKRVIASAPRVINIDLTRTNRLSARITDVDVISDLMIHDIDLAIYLNGPVVKVHAQGVIHGGLVEFASANLTHAGGTFSRLQASRITEKKIRLIQATCGDRFVDCDLLRKEILISRQSRTQQESAESYVISSHQESVVVGQQEALLSELQAFIGNLAGDTPCEVPGYADGMEALRVAEMIRELIS